jgi:putative spermidine/putrescine transport system permease protein
MFFSTRNSAGAAPSPALIIAHAALGVISPMLRATLGGFDRSLFVVAVLSLRPHSRSSPGRCQSSHPPGVISGGLFAFVTSFDEVIIWSCFLQISDGQFRVKMFSGPARTD